MKSKRAESVRRRKRKMEQRERRIRRRQASRGRCPQDRPVLGRGKVTYDVADRLLGVGAGGIGAVHRLVQDVGLAEEIDAAVEVLKLHLPYHESDHVLNVAYNVLCGGRSLEDLEQRRHDEGYHLILGASRIPDPTTAGDFCRRFRAEDVEALMQAIDRSRRKIWSRQPESFFDEAVLDVDSTIVATTGECKQGMALSYNGIWGYHPLLVSLANTGEPLSLENRSGNRPSDEGAASRLDDALDLCRGAGFRQILLRGDTAFSQSRHLDRWSADGVRFLFGYAASENLVQSAEALPEAAWQELDRPASSAAASRARPPRIKEQIVVDRQYRNIRRTKERVAEFAYRPVACQRSYRMVVVRKDLEVMRGQELLFPDVKYFFYVTNDRRQTAPQIVRAAHGRCAQEKLIDQLKNQVCALRSPLGDLVSNWAYMVMASLAWTLKAWMGLAIPAAGRWAARRREQRRALLQMHFRRFVEEVIRIPAQILTTGRRVVCRLLAWTRSLAHLLRVVDTLEHPLRC